MKTFLLFSSINTILLCNVEDHFVEPDMIEIDGFLVVFPDEFKNALHVSVCILSRPVRCMFKWDKWFSKGQQ